MKKVLFVCYGSGHVRMVLPLAQALQASGRAQVQVLGLTTAAAVVSPRTCTCARPLACKACASGSTMRTWPLP